MSDEPVPAVPESNGPSSKPKNARTKRIRFFAIWGSLALFVVLLFRGVLLPFFLAVVVAYVFEPIVAWATRPRGARRPVPRWIAVVTLYVALLATIGIFLATGMPRLVVEVQRLARDVPHRIAEAREAWLPKVEQIMRRTLGSYDDAAGTPPAAPGEPTPDDGSADAIRVVPLAEGGFEVRLPRRGIVVSEEGDRLLITEARHAVERQRGDVTSAFLESLKGISADTSTHAGSLLGAVQAVVRSLVRSVFGFFIMLMLSAYILITKDAILEFFRVLVQPANRDRFDSLLRRIDRGLSGVVRGQLVICVVNGALSGIGFYALRLPYWPILTLIATVLSIIPIFGAILSSVPAIIVGLQVSFTTGLLALAWILVIHQIEANLLNPKIMGDSAKVHPVLVVFALLAGEHLFGVAGALLAVPVLSITQSIFLHNRESALGIAAPRADRSRA